MADNLKEVSEQLLLQVKTDKDTSQLEAQLEKTPLEYLTTDLSNDNQKKAFWINIYNAYYQILRTKKQVNKQYIYKNKLFTIASTLLSLDDVEHGILRANKYKYSLGYFGKIFVADFITNHMVEQLDYRIHFALNCGAKSCPPIAFYKPDGLDAQLDLATQSFLEGETEYEEGKKVVHVTSLFKWFCADFGGSGGIKSIYKQQLDKDLSDYKVKYKPYSWEDDLGNFV